jgi:hypothetical protein
LLRATDPPDVAFATQLADDLSGRYGPYLIKFRTDYFAGLRDGVKLYGAISRDGAPVGLLRVLGRVDGQRELAVSLGVDGVDGQPVPDRAQLYRALETTLGPYFIRCGIDPSAWWSEWLE